LNQLEDFRDLEKSLNLINLVNEFHGSMEKNIEVISQYSEIIEKLSAKIRLNFLLKEKEKFLKELEITEEFEKSSDTSAISDLLEKLNKSLSDNKKKLKYLEEDYFQRKNQIDQLNSTINNYKQQIQNLTKKKKEFFSQINRITREMSGNSNKEREEQQLIPEIDDSLTNAQKIKAFQNKAKETQRDINKLNQKVEETNLKFKEFNPLYETYKNDYEKLKKIINTDDIKVRELELELKTKFLNKNNSHYDYNGFDLKSVRSIDEVKIDIKKINNEIETISVPNSISDLQDPEDLSEIIENLKDFDNNLKKNQNNIKISKNKEEIIQIFDSFQKLEALMDDLEIFINRFLSQINLKSQFRILLSEDNKNFFIQIGFTRNMKEKITFDELTTPEKIFFIIICNISIGLQVKNHNIVFSNLFIPSVYNKAGSIFRTIRKILPLFDTEEYLSKFNLIFIFSSLEMKKEIKNVKIITIQENG